MEFLINLAYGILLIVFFNMAGIHYAVIENDVKTFSYILQIKGVKIDIEDDSKSTILHLGARYERLRIVKEILQKAPYLINRQDICGIKLLFY